MKKFLLLVVIAGIGLFLLYNEFEGQTEEVERVHPKTIEPLVLPIEPIIADHMSLLLVNQQHAYTETPTNLVKLPRTFVSNVQINDDFLVQAPIVRPLKQLFEAAAADGVNHFIINSAYRPMELQSKLHAQYGDERALPAGYSEHATGLSVDIGSTLGLMENAEEGKWLANNAHRFGFIVRYPADKIDITGIGFEPWHIRYVGLPHSVFMHDNNFAFEEYIAHLKAHPYYTLTIDDVTYTVQYTTEATMKKMQTRQYNISSTNEGGHIVTSMTKKNPPQEQGTTQ